MRHGQTTDIHSLWSLYSEINHLECLPSTAAITLTSLCNSSGVYSHGWYFHCSYLEGRQLETARNLWKLKYSHGPGFSFLKLSASWEGSLYQTETAAQSAAPVGCPNRCAIPQICLQQSKFIFSAGNHSLRNIHLTIPKEFKILQTSLTMLK